MRRVFLLILVVVMVFSVGCGQKNEAGVPTNTEKVNKETDKETPEKSPEAEAQDTKTSLAPLIKAEKELPGGFIVSIDNHPNAYPQSGLDKADRVYELLAEGGITRYLAIFNSQAVEKVGPIRSARYYFAYIVKGHDLPFAHAGGNTDALNLIPQLHIKDLDEIYNAGSFFWRDKGRKMPHNLYTSTEKLVKGAEHKNYKLLPLKPLKQGEVQGGSAVDLIDITYSNDPRYLYAVTYEWDGNCYKRYINGTPHETPGGEEIFTENLIVMETKTREVVKEELQSEMELIGSGKAIFFTNGQAYEGTWKKAKSSSEFEFFYNDQPMKFKGEHAWINIVPSLNAVKMTETP